MSKKISVNTLEKYSKAKENEKMLTFELDGVKIEFTVKRRISLSEFIAFVADVAAEYVDAENSRIIPVARQIVIDRNLLTYYANFTMPKDVSKAYEYVAASSDIVDKVRAEIDQSQYTALLSAIDEQLSFERQKLVAEQTFMLNKAVAQINNLSEKMESMFTGVDGTQVTNLVKLLSESNSIDANGLAKAFVSTVTEK